MGQKYTRIETISQIEEASKDMSIFYRAPCVNHTGTTYKSDGNEYYTEIISEYLLRNYSLFNQVIKINRGNYKVNTHTGTTPRATSNRKEERIALAMAQQKVLNPIGEVIDYQIPLKSQKIDDAGKIDLMTFDNSSGILRLIELKAPKSKETLLRCVLEIFTYYKTADITKLLESYDLADKCKEIRICPMFFKGSNQDKEYNTLADRKNIVDLMNAISNDGAKVELLRFPFEDVKLSSSLPQKNSNSNNISIATNAHMAKPIIMIPVFEQPDGFPIALDEVSSHEVETYQNWEIEILDY